MNPHPLIAEILASDGAAAGGIVGLLMLLGKVIRDYTPVPTRWIPLILWLLGIVAFVLQSLDAGAAITFDRAVEIALLAASATGLHAVATKSTRRENNPAKPADLP